MKQNKAIRQIIKLSLAFLILFYFQSCRKSIDAPFAPIPFNYIDDITYTDAVGFTFGPIDSTDWTTTDIFSPTIDALFSFNDTINYNNADTSSISVYPAFPNPNYNPFNETVSIHYNSSQVTVLKFVVVDSAQNVIMRYAKKINPGHDKVELSFNDPTAPLNSKYRMLYRFYNAPNAYYKSGHGDILIN